MESEARIVRLEENMEFVKKDLHRMTEAIKDISLTLQHQTKLFEENLRIHNRIDRMEEKINECKVNGDVGCPALKISNLETRNLHNRIEKIEAGNKKLDDLDVLVRTDGFIKGVPFLALFARIMDNVAMKLGAAIVVAVVGFYFVRTVQ